MPLCWALPHPSTTQMLRLPSSVARCLIPWPSSSTSLFPRWMWAILCVAENNWALWGRQLGGDLLPACPFDLCLPAPLVFCWVYRLLETCFPFADRCLLSYLISSRSRILVLHWYADAPLSVRRCLWEVFRSPKKIPLNWSTAWWRPLGSWFGFDEIFKLQKPGATKKTLGSLLSQKKTANHFGRFRKIWAWFCILFLRGMFIPFHFLSMFSLIFFRDVEISSPQPQSLLVRSGRCRNTTSSTRIAVTFVRTTPVSSQMDGFRDRIFVTGRYSRRRGVSHTFPPKTNMTMEHATFEDVFPIENIWKWSFSNVMLVFQECKFFVNQIVHISYLELFFVACAISSPPRAFWIFDPLDPLLIGALPIAGSWAVAQSSMDAQHSKN